jgi:exodeoxyribonuclease III
MTRLATWNINGLRARIDYILHWLDARQPDVVGFQELKITDELFPTETFEQVGYHVVTHGQKAWNGVAVLSKEPVTTVQSGLPGQADFGARLLTTQVASVQFTTVYCPNGKKVEHDDYPRKLAWFDSLHEYMTAALAAGTPHILCGDFNICPTSLDTWDETAHDGQIFHTKAERERLQALIDCGLVDIYREHFPDTQAFSWWDYRAGSFQRNHGLRIDFVLASPALLPRVQAVTIDRDYRKKKEGLTASDHAPVYIDLDD